MNSEIYDEIKNAVIAFVDNDFSGKTFASIELVFEHSPSFENEKQAETFLKEFGVNKAKNIISDFEEKNFGCVSTDFSDSIDFMNMLAGVLAYQQLQNLSFNYINDNNRSQVIDELKSL